MEARQKTFLFGPFEFDGGAWELRKSGRPVRLQQQSKVLLLTLLERRGDVITREELRKVLWPKDEFVDFETGLNAAVKKLRAALGDSSSSPKYITTVPKVGYRFTDPEASGTASGKFHSLAVLPFESTLGKEFEFLSDGLVDALIDSLSRLPGLRKVIARNSAFRYQNRDPKEAGKDLGVQRLLTGRIVRSDAGQLRVTVELVDSLDAKHVWGNRYECGERDLVDLHQQITADLLRQRGTKQHEAVKQQQPQQAPRNFEATRFYLRGRQLWNRRPAVGSVERALEAYQQAVAIQPDFAEAYVGIADAYNTLGGWESGTMEPRAAFENSRAASECALRLNSALAEAHTSRGYTLFHYDWNPKAAETSFLRALDLNSNYSHAHHWYAHVLLAEGRASEALEHSRRILELDPHDLIINIHMAWHHYMACDFEAALQEARNVLEVEPNFHWAYFFMGLALEALGERRDSVTSLQKSVDLSRGSTVMISALAHAAAVAGDHDRARDLLQNLIALSDKRYISSYEIGLIHAGLGEMEAAIGWLEKAVEERSGWIPYLSLEPRLLPFHKNGELNALERRVQGKPGTLSTEATAT